MFTRPGSQVSPADQRRITGGARASRLWSIYDPHRALEHNSGPTISTAVPAPIARTACIVNACPPRLVCTTRRQTSVPRRQGFLRLVAGIAVPRLPHGAVAPGGGADRGVTAQERAEAPAGTPGCRRGSRSGLRDGPLSAGRLRTRAIRAGRRTPARDHPAGPGSDRRPDAPERRGGARPARSRVTGVQEGAAARCVAPCPGITLSDERGQEERAHSRCSGRFGRKGLGDSLVVHH